MMIFNVETHGDIRFCPICRRYIVTIANSPHPVARPRTVSRVSVTGVQPTESWRELVERRARSAPAWTVERLS